MDFTLARASILLLYIFLGFGITIPPYWYCFNGGKFEEELSSVNLLFIFKNNLLNIVISVLHHDFSFLLDQKRNKKIFMRYYCFFVFMTRAWKANGWNNLRFHRLKIKNLKTTSKHRSAPRAVRQKAQLAERCHSVFSLFFYVFNLRAGLKLVIIKFYVYF